MKQHFDRQAAEAKVGKRVRSLVEFSGVPRGTSGRVAAADPAGRVKPAGQDSRNIYDVAIEWDLPSRQFGTQAKPLRDWFTKGEYEQYLVEE